MGIKKFEKIKQFKDAIQEIYHLTKFEKVNDDGTRIYNDDPLPTLTFTGTAKLHGTNAGIQLVDGKLIPQSRNNILSIQNDNFGFASWVHMHHDDIAYHLNLKEGEIVYGEWAGNGIQSGVGISEFDPAFYVFESPRKITPYKDIGLYDIKQFPTYQLEIDFNNPKLAIDRLICLTEQVERECPVSKFRGVSGIGEGVVWKCIYKDQIIRFKVKGEKHSVTKVKKLASVDPEKVKSVIEFVDKTVTENRVKQAIQETKAKEKKDTPLILKWVANDIIDEETDMLITSGLEWKDVASKVANKTREIYFKMIQ